MTEELSELRESVFDLGQNIWVSERSDISLAERSFEETQIVCLENVRQSERLVCVLDGSYGTAKTSWNPSEVSLLELELATALIVRKPIHIFLLAPRAKHYEEDVRLSSFLRVVRNSRSAFIDETPRPPKEIVTRIRALVERPRRSVVRRIAGAFGRLAQWLFIHRRLRNREKGLDVRFLDAEFAPVVPGRPDVEAVAEMLKAADSAQDMLNRLTHLWKCFRYLSGAPYSDPRHREFLPLWNSMLTAWASAAAWSDLHGHFFLGRLAATNSLREVGEALSGAGLASGAGRNVHGDVASEYYSISKLVPSRRYRRRLLGEALSNANQALAADGDEPSGLLLIRGSIRLQLRDVRGAVEDYERALEVRRAAGEGPGRTGEAQSYLGFGYFRRGRVRQAQEMLEAGVHNLRNSDRIPFTVSAMKKLCAFYTLTLRLRLARETLDEAYALANQHGLYGQARQLDSLKKFLRLYPASSGAKASRR
jgi:tetratricopeptide (TPR) repeat protein